MKSILLAVSLALGISLSAQINVFTEDFDGATQNVSSSSASNNNNAAWALNTNFQSNGTRSDSARVTLGDTLYLTTNSFSTVGFSFVTLTFDQICKIDFFDKAYVEVSDDNGATWTRLTNADYTGTAFFNTSYFSSISYTVWDAINGTARPTNSWWQSESFNITAIAGVANARVRFMLEDADNNGAVNNYGWLIDNIVVTAAPCELIPPTINLSGTVFQGQVYSLGPYTVQADITDASGIASSDLTYTVNGGTPTTISMINSSANSYTATIPAAIVGDTVCYTITATDNSSCSNVQQFPSLGCTQFIVGSNPPPVCVGTPVFTYDYTETFASFTPGNGSSTVGTLQNNWVNATTDNHDWFVLNRSTSSAGTGPISNHSIGDANFMYVEASGFSNSTAILNTPCFDLNGLFAPEFSFWYHMLGNQMGELHVDIYFGGVWVLDVTPAIIGNQGNRWIQRKVDLSAYRGNIVKLRFRGITGGGFQSDIAIDDIELNEPLRKDIFLSDIFSPSPNGCAGSANEFLTIEITNLGSLSLDTIPVAYQVNNGPIVVDTAFISLNTGDSANFTFQQTANLSVQGNYSFRFWTALSGDLDTSNDSILTYAITTSQVFTQFPDSTNFDNFGVGNPGTLFDSWANSVFDTHDWYVSLGGTPSSGTGPLADHTTGTGNYMYVEASNFNNETAILNSRCIDISSLNRPELTFYYHMEGLDMGSLSLDVSVNGFVISNIMPSIVGNQGSRWNLATVDLTPYKGVVKLLFRANVGNGFRSDIAIDDVVIKDALPVGTIENTVENLDWSFYPNPADQQVFISNPRSINSAIRIYNALGKLVLEKQITEVNAILDIANLSKGVYFIEFQNENALQRERLIIQ